ncbi:MAG: hypothetical protein PHH26_01145 [Candidatus Thermoplasmatota archaeon]|nr:hypothetical protein [Candidatus Thermoplasmatota archaeon]
MDELGYRFERSSGTKMATRIIILIPIPSKCYVFRFAVTGKGESEIKPIYFDIYDKRLTQNTFVPVMEVSGYDETRQEMKEILNKLIEKLPRKPWDFNFAQKSAIGLLNADILRAKGDWARALG